MTHEEMFNEAIKKVIVPEGGIDIALDAIKESIRHWERMRANVYCGERPDSNGCALCVLYKDTEPACLNCPVRAVTGMKYCGGTPYDSAENAWYAYTHYPHGYPPAEQRLKELWEQRAGEQIDFLKGLLNLYTKRKQLLEMVMDPGRQVTITVVQEEEKERSMQDATNLTDQK